MPVLGGNAIDHGKAYAGLVADDQLSNTVSGLVTGSANVAYGSAVFRGTNAGEVTAGSAASTAEQFVGVLKYELNRAYATGQTFGAVVDMDASVVTVGVIWVQVAEAVTAGAPAFAGLGATVRGKWAAAEGAAATLAVAIPNAKFLDAAGANGLARVSIVVGG